MASLLGNLRTAFAGFWSRFGGLGLSRFRFLLPGSRFDWEREAGDLWTNSIVAIAIKWLGARFPKPLLRVSKIAANGDYEPLGRHELVDLWNRPNPYYGRRTMEKAIGLSLVTDGNAYLYKVRSGSGRVVQLWWVPHDRMLPMWPQDGSEFISGYKLRVDGMYFDLPAADVIHFRDGIDPRNERLGLSALKAQCRELVTVNEESGYAAGLLKNSGVPSVMVIPDGDKVRPDGDAARRIKEMWKDATSGDSRGDAVVLAGQYKVVPVGFSPEDLRLDKLPANAQARIGAACGVALMSLNLPDPGKTYSNVVEANRSSWNTITEVNEIIEESLRWGLLSEFADPHQYVVEHDYSHVMELQENLDTRSTRIREEWKAGIRKRGEAREELGLDTDSEHDDEYFPGTTPSEAPEVPAIGEAEPPPVAPADGQVDAEDEAIKSAMSLLQVITKRIECNAQADEAGCPAGGCDCGHGCAHRAAA